MGVKGLKEFLKELRAAYPEKLLVLVWDNWTVHRHPQVLAEAARLKIHIKWLPTYAPWTNPIEKLWRWLKQELLHHHHKADQWEELKAQVVEFLNQFKEGSTQLLHYVGLLPFKLLNSINPPPTFIRG
jgi:transposase